MHVDDAFMERFDLLVTHIETSQRLLPDIGDEDVRRCCQLPHGLQIIFLLQVKHHGLLAPVERHVTCAN